MYWGFNKIWGNKWGYKSKNHAIAWVCLKMVHTPIWSLKFAISNWPSNFGASRKIPWKRRVGSLKEPGFFSFLQQSCEVRCSKGVNTINLANCWLRASISIRSWSRSKSSRGQASCSRACAMDSASCRAWGRSFGASKSERGTKECNTTRRVEKHGHDHLAQPCSSKLNDLPSSFEWIIAAQNSDTWNLKPPNSF